MRMCSHYVLTLCAYMTNMDPADPFGWELADLRSGSQPHPKPKVWETRKVWSPTNWELHSQWVWLPRSLEASKGTGVYSHYVLVLHPYKQTCEAKASHSVGIASLPHPPILSCCATQCGDPERELRSLSQGGLANARWVPT